MKKILQQSFMALLVLLLVADLTYSYYQYSHSFIDGDFPTIVLGIHPYNRVLHEPIGWAAIEGAHYAAVNRFTSHIFMSAWFKNVPLWLQHFMSPVDSLYKCIAATKLLTHILLLFMLSYYVSAWNGFKWKFILIAAVLITPLFHAGDFYMNYLAVIDPCITYISFYALPMIAILIFFVPFYRYYITGEISQSIWFRAGWSIFVFFLVFFGTLTAPVLIISSLIIFRLCIGKNFAQSDEPESVKRLLKSIVKINTGVLLIFALVLVWSLYSIYLGTKNTENSWSPMPLDQRFALLPKGIVDAFFNLESGLVQILAATLLNLLLLYFVAWKKHHRYFKLIFFLIVFCIIYILFLPMGGYRFYRPLILRRDTLIPVLCIIFYSWATSSLLLLLHFKRIKRVVYVVFVGAVAYFYTDKDINLSQYLSGQREKQTILKIASATGNCVVLDKKKDVTVASWVMNQECFQSENATTLLEHYNILPRHINFYYADSPNVEISSLRVK